MANFEMSISKIWPCPWTLKYPQKLDSNKFPPEVQSQNVKSRKTDYNVYCVLQKVIWNLLTIQISFKRIPFLISGVGYNENI